MEYPRLVQIAKQAAQDYCWERYKARDPLDLKTPAVFSSHEWQKIGERIDAALQEACMTDDEVMEHLRNGTPLSKVVTVFSGCCGKLEQADMQRQPPTPVERQKMKFDCVQRILDKAEEVGLIVQKTKGD